MTSFFRKIRQTLLLQKKTTQYLSYAFSEIVLVVVGILLALYINNLNENRKTRTAEEDLLNNLKTELNKIEEDLDETMKRHHSSHESGLKLLSYFGRDVSNIPNSKFDSLLMDMETAWTFESRDGYIQSIITSGNINYIRNEKLKSMLTAYQGNVIDATQEIIPIQTLLHQRLWPIIDGKINSTNRLKVYDPEYQNFPDGSYQSDYSWFFEQREIEDIISNIESWRVSVLKDERTLNHFIEDMLQLVDLELKR